MDYFFTFRSVTAAMGSSRALEQAGIKNQMVRTPTALRQQGCGYSLRVSEGRLHETKQVRGEVGGRCQTIYRKEADATWEDITRRLQKAQ